MSDELNHDIHPSEKLDIVAAYHHFKAECERLRADLAESRRTNRGLRSLVEMHEELKAEAKEDLAAMKERAERAEQALAAERTKTTRLKSELDYQIREVNEADKNFAETDAQVDKLRADLAEIKTKQCGASGYTDCKLRHRPDSPLADTGCYCWRAQPRPEPAA